MQTAQTRESKGVGTGCFRKKFRRFAKDVSPTGMRNGCHFTGLMVR
ncbi:MAG: hypothetical protein HFI91_01405 [Lachnospiraceae bacterium]|nr:hypothetical protein [Lachnospiraceae bacterium]